MFKKILLLLLIVCHISACSAMKVQQSNSFDDYGEMDILTSSSDSDSSASHVAAAPFYVVGVIGMGLGLLIMSASDTENYEAEKQSDGENFLIGAGLTGLGFLSWKIGDSIAD